MTRRDAGLVRALLLAAALAAGPVRSQEAEGGPAPPANVRAADHPHDGGEVLDVSWDLSPDDGAAVVGYRVYRTMTAGEVAAADAEARRRRVETAMDEAARAAAAAADAEGTTGSGRAARIRAARRQAAGHAGRLAEAEVEDRAGRERYRLVATTGPGVAAVSVGNLSRAQTYGFMVEALAAGGSASAPALSAAAVGPRRQWFDENRFYLMIISLVFCGSVVVWIALARGGRPIKVRRIAGLAAVDEAVGRATEMGRPCLFVPGIQDMNDIQTIAAMTVLARVARTAAEHGARVEVPTSRSLVMTTARETVQAAFTVAGRPDAYSEELIYYVTDEQFGYVAYLSGMMSRQKPAACFYMGAFFAESLILAESGNAIGAIQVAGTAQPAQLPFFVAACDYTLIGEEFFAASAYLSGSPSELGSLKGQDVGKVLVGLIVIVGTAMATLAAVTGSPGLQEAVEYLRNAILT